MGAHGEVIKLLPSESGQVVDDDKVDLTLLVLHMWPGGEAVQRRPAARSF
jgi:hypothetical protein